MLLQLKKLINKFLIFKLMKKIIQSSYSIYKSTTQNRINTMWIQSNISKIIGSDYSLKDIAIKELIAEQKITLEHDDNGDASIILSDSIIRDNAHDYLSMTAFLKKYRADIIAILAFIVSIVALLKP